MSLLLSLQSSVLTDGTRKTFKTKHKWKKVMVSLKEEMKAEDSTETTQNGIAEEDATHKKEAQVSSREAQVPGREAQVPGKDAQVPGQEAQVPGKEAQVPGKETQVPGKEAQVSGKDDQVPSKEAQVPGKEAQVSAKEVQVPGEEVQVPGKEAQVTDKEVQVPSKETQVPSKEAQVSGKDTQVPSKEVQVPGKEVQVPSKEVQVPSKETEVPSKETQVPGKEAGLSVDDSRSTGGQTVEPAIQDRKQRASMSGIRCDGQSVAQLQVLASPDMGLANLRRERFKANFVGTPTSTWLPVARKRAGSTPIVEMRQQSSTQAHTTRRVSLFDYAGKAFNNLFTQNKAQHKIVIPRVMISPPTPDSSSDEDTDTNTEE